ncbi:hypothetical protein ACIBF6_00370 [Streptosporangium amethystogenes]|uniref:hypothetical protein n=1 Tax=Streptosporangium amethystogenes TaxID=2002 RepID=UPI0037931EE5
MSIGIATGVLIWGAVGAWTAVTVQNYPWNKWVPFANGASKGVLLGLFAAVGVAIALAGGSRTGWRWAVFSGALIGGGLIGTIRDLLGPPAPAVYFEEPIPDERWYGTTMLLHWTGKVVLPALVCAVILTLLVARPYRRAQSVLAGAALALAGVALLPMTGAGTATSTGRVAPSAGRPPSAIMVIGRRDGSSSRCMSRRMVPPTPRPCSCCTVAVSQVGCGSRCGNVSRTTTG